MTSLLLIYWQDAHSDITLRGDFKAFRPVAGRHTAAVGWYRFSHAKFQPNTNL